MKAIVDDNFERVVKGDDFSQMGFTHAILSGCKANYTQFVVHTAEWCRLSCGGHGFAHYSGLPAIYKDTAPNVCDNIFCIPFRLFWRVRILF